MNEPSLLLYDYYRSSAAYRVRIALNLKGLPYRQQSVHLSRDGGEHRQAGYARINPQQLVPTLVDGEITLSQSLAIIDYLEERYPERPLLPDNAADRARVRQAALAIACDIHPLNNLRVLNFLVSDLGADEAAKRHWYHHWILASFPALEQWAAGGPYFLGDTPTLADLCIVPQMFNARRFDVPLDEFPRLCAIDAACRALPAFRDAEPDRQADAA